MAGKDLNNEDEMFVTLTLDDDTEVECIVITIFEAAGKDYIALLPIEDENEDEGEVYLFLFESLNNRGTPLTAIDLMKNLIMARAEINNLTIDDCFNRWQMLLGNLSDDYSTQERFFRQYYNAFKRRLNEPFQSGNDRKKDPLGNIATRSNLLNIFENLINKNLPLFLEDVLCCGEIYSYLILKNTDTPYKKALEDLDHIQGAPSYLLCMRGFYMLLIKSKSKISGKSVDIVSERVIHCKWSTVSYGSERALFITK